MVEILDIIATKCHIEHMKRISIRELHMQTGKWIRNAACQQRIIVTERGHPIATIAPYSPDDSRTPFSQRHETPEFSTLPKINVDSARLISDDRERG